MNRYGSAQRQNTQLVVLGLYTHALLRVCSASSKSAQQPLLLPCQHSRSQVVPAGLCESTLLIDLYKGCDHMAQLGCPVLQIDKLAAAEAAAAAAAAIAASRRSDPPATNVAAIVAPIVVSAFLVLAGVGAVWFLVQRRRSRAADSKESLLPVAMKQPPPGSADPRSSSDHYGHQGSAPGLANPDLLPGPYRYVATKPCTGYSSWLGCLLIAGLVTAWSDVKGGCHSSLCRHPCCVNPQQAVYADKLALPAAALPISSCQWCCRQHRVSGHWQQGRQLAASSIPRCP